MALLAETKRKVKYGIDPRNTNWSNDESKFGQRLMEKMGWEKGKGLGASESGMTEHVKASYKSDTRGLGCSLKDADSWVAHQDDFNDLLKTLNSAHGDGTEKEDKPKTDGQKRYYGRFARGRVQTLRSTDDLDCIFGKRKTSSAPESSASDSDSNGEAKTEKTEHSHGLKTVISSSSVQEYFAQKMAQLKARKAGSASAEENSAELNGETDLEKKSDNERRVPPIFGAVGFSYDSEIRQVEETKDTTVSSPKEDVEPSLIERKSKKKRKKANGQDCEDENNNDSSKSESKKHFKNEVSDVKDNLKKKNKRERQNISAYEDSSEIVKGNEEEMTDATIECSNSRKKSKKRKKSKSSDTLDVEPDTKRESDQVTETCLETSKTDKKDKLQKKSKSKKNVKIDADDNDSCLGQEGDKSQPEVRKKGKKEKKIQKSQDSVAMEAETGDKDTRVANIGDCSPVEESRKRSRAEETEDTEDKPIAKKKKKSSKKTRDDTAEEICTKSKAERTSKTSEEAMEVVSQDSTEVLSEELQSTTREKKKSKKSKKKHSEMERNSTSSLQNNSVQEPSREDCKKKVSKKRVRFSLPEQEENTQSDDQVVKGEKRKKKKSAKRKSEIDKEIAVDGESRSPKDEESEENGCTSLGLKSVEDNLVEKKKESEKNVGESSFNDIKPTEKEEKQESQQVEEDGEKLNNKKKKGKRKLSKKEKEEKILKAIEGPFEGSNFGEIIGYAVVKKSSSIVIKNVEDKHKKENKESPKDKESGENECTSLGLKSVEDTLEEKKKESEKNICESSFNDIKPIENGEKQEGEQVKEDGEQVEEDGEKLNKKKKKKKREKETLKGKNTEGN